MTYCTRLCLAVWLFLYPNTQLMAHLEGFSFKTSLEIFVEGFVIIAKCMYLLGYITGKFVFSTKSWILQTLEDAKSEMNSQNWNNFQFLIPITITSKLTLAPIWHLIIQSYNYLTNQPIDWVTPAPVPTTIAMCGDDDIGYAINLKFCKFY